ncbi:synapse-associated protein of 47 kDa isoform X2 [Cimex lectularius]|uniref:BSD domain-containing protein n=1 Tax=Cimex lectularius TaxID=79782 RepID=A0A8I6TFG5_CIMLE|nr:synapse-associated protein of 47 kDa isoform X2 [Cimex lectularius]
MFSSLTNQVSGWMGKKSEGADTPKEEAAPQDEAPAQAPTDEEPAPEAKKDPSPTKGGSRLEMLGNLGGLGNVKTQMSSWLGGGIPGLGKKSVDPATAEAGAEGSPPQLPASPTSQLSNKGSPQEKDDDASSATGGADSDAHASEASGSPVEDKDPTQTMGAVSTKAIAGAKSFGNFLYSAVNKAGKTVSEASAKIKKSVEENSLLGEFNKEQEAFIKEKQGKGNGTPVPPWVGCPNQDSLKEECLSLSTDRRNFVRAPPEGVDFTFDYESQFPVCEAILAEDPNLEKMRFELVPKVISEENFWRNYLYRVSLICQANEVSSMAQEKSEASAERTGSVEVQPPGWGSGDQPDGMSRGRLKDDSPQEFVSDTFAASSAADLAEVNEGMKKLGIDANLTEEDWERELEAELQDYELVGDTEKVEDNIDLLEELSDLK